MQNGNKRYGTARPRVFQAENKVFPRGTLFEKGYLLYVFSEVFYGDSKPYQKRAYSDFAMAFAFVSYAFGKKEERMELLSRRRLGLPNRRETCV